MFTAVLFTIEHGSDLDVHQKMNIYIYVHIHIYINLRYTYTMEYYSTIKRNAFECVPVR